MSVTVFFFRTIAVAVLAVLLPAAIELFLVLLLAGVAAAEIAAPPGAVLLMMLTLLPLAGAAALSLTLLVPRFLVHRRILSPLHLT
jgi:hypothetical protein